MAPGTGRWPREVVMASRAFRYPTPESTPAHGPRGRWPGSGEPPAASPRAQTSQFREHGAPWHTLVCPHSGSAHTKATVRTWPVPSAALAAQSAEASRLFEPVAPSHFGHHWVPRITPSGLRDSGREHFASSVPIDSQLELASGTRVGTSSGFFQRQQRCSAICHCGSMFQHDRSTVDSVGQQHPRPAMPGLRVPRQSSGMRFTPQRSHGRATNANTVH